MHTVFLQTINYIYIPTFVQQGSANVHNFYHIAQTQMNSSKLYGILYIKIDLSLWEAHVQIQCNGCALKLHSARSKVANNENLLHIT